MADCCTNAACEIDKLRDGQRSTLRIVLGINVAMFGIEVVAGLLAGSTALLADSLDMLGDALVYGFSLYVVARSDAWKAGSALLKGGIMGAFGLFVLGHAGYKLLYPQVPHVEAVGLIGLLALAANSVCLSLLWRHRAEDVNMRSVWLCSRNDIIANTAVLAAAGGVWLSHSQWPDLLIGLGIAALFLHSSLQVIRDAARTCRAHQRAPQTDSDAVRHAQANCAGRHAYAESWRPERERPGGAEEGEASASSKKRISMSSAERKGGRAL